MLRFKPEVRVGYMNKHLLDVLQAASLWSLLTRIDVQVSSINDPAPNRVSDTLHAYDLAIDLEPVNGKADDLRQLAEYLRRWLHPQFDVVYESNHAHVEWDAHRAPLHMVAS